MATEALCMAIDTGGYGYDATVEMLISKGADVPWSLASRTKSVFRGDDAQGRGPLLARL